MRTIKKLRAKLRARARKTEPTKGIKRIQKRVNKARSARIARGGTPRMSATKRLVSIATRGKL